MSFEFKTNVLLPEWCFSQAQNTEQLKRLVLDYMQKCYPEYKVKQIKDGMAVCERK
ncbi:hypothetical protein HNR53_003159 [Bacillus benzoevorans]|uniref:Uncharacterized protein n=1 Tax=Bacillus benzoevorans TaxID=1456 RepID=A0A7X0LWC0_9BACI|nr:hypothetical protein [Bacillus benzoevorans]